MLKTTRYYLYLLSIIIITAVNCLVTTVASLYWHKKKLPSTSLVKMAQGTFIEAQITNMEIICHAHMEGRWYTGRKLYQIWADWAVHARCYLQKGMTFHFNIGDFGFLKDGLSHFYQWSAWQLFFVSVQPRNSSGKAVSAKSGT